MRIAKGIKGIRKTINENKSGWHIYSTENHLGYHSQTFIQLLNMYETYTIVGVFGNVISVEKSI
jgi:hypothetical protein